MARQRLSQIGLGAGYAGAALVVIAALLGIFRPGFMATPVLVALIVGMVMLVLSFFTSGIVGGRQMKYGTNALIMTLLFAIILGFGFYLLKRYPLRWDATKEKLFTLSDQTVTILQNLKEPVKAIAFMTPGQSDELSSVEELLRGYERHSDKFKFEAIDPYVDPVRARDLKVQELGTVVFIAGDESAVVAPKPVEGAPPAAEPANPKRYAVSKNDYIEYDYAAAQMGQAPTPRFKGEQAFTTALLNVTGGEKKKVYFLAGHDEESFSSQDGSGMSALKDAMDGEGYTVEELHLAQTHQVPKDAAMVIVAGPKRPLLPLEAEILVNYIKAGGRAMVLPNIFGTPALNEVLNPFGIQVGDDIVIDPQSRSLLSPSITVAASYEFHEVTEKMTAYTIFPAARSLTVSADTKPWTDTPIIKTTEAAWAETNSQRARYDQGVDKPGPIDLAVLVEGPSSDVPAEVAPGKAPAAPIQFSDVEMPTPKDAADANAPAEVVPPADANAPAAPAEAEPTSTTPGGGQGGGNEAEAPTPAPDAGPGTAAAATSAAPAGAKTLRWSDQARLAVFGTSAMLNNDYLLGAGNKDLILNTMNWLVGKKELISIRAKDTRLPPMTMMDAELDRVFWITMVFVPLAILLLGMVIWYKRR